jgi:hypothetical protein
MFSQDIQSQPASSQLHDLGDVEQSISLQKTANIKECEVIAGFHWYNPHPGKSPGTVALEKPSDWIKDNLSYQANEHIT